MSVPVSKRRSWGESRYLDLLPCPSCGSEDIDVQHVGNDVTRKRSIVIKCCGCRIKRTDAAIRNGFDWLEKVAEKNWNQRPATTGPAPWGRLFVAEDLPDAREILGRVLRNLHRVVSYGASGVTWSVIGRLTGNGSTYSARLCRALEIDPDAIIGETDWESLDALLGESTYLDEEEWERVFPGIDPPPESERTRDNSALKDGAE